MLRSLISPHVLEQYSMSWLLSTSVWKMKRKVRKSFCMNFRLCSQSLLITILVKQFRKFLTNFLIWSKSNFHSFDFVSLNNIFQMQNLHLLQHPEFRNVTNMEKSQIIIWFLTFRNRITKKRLKLTILYIRIVFLGKTSKCQLPFEFSSVWK